MTTNSGTKYVIDAGAFSIEYLQQTGYSSMPGPHAHPAYEIFYVLNGGRVFFINETVYTVEKGDMIFIHPNDVHRTTSSQALKCERILVNFLESFIVPELSRSSVRLLPLSRPSPLFRFPVNEQAAIEELLRSMLHECQTQDEGCVTYVRALLAKLLVRLYRHHRKEHEMLTSPAHPMHQKISEIAAYLNEHFQQNVTLRDVARQFYISPSYLSRVFKKITGFQFKEYLQIIRVREAQRLLRESDDSIGLIAEKTGFAHTANFNVTFKALTGITPGYYRRSTR